MPSEAMRPEALKVWVARNKSRQITAKCLGACLSFVGGSVVLIFTFAFVYFVAWLASDGFLSVYELVSGVKLKLSSTGLYAFSGVFMVLLFVQALRMDPMAWGRYPSREINVDPRLRNAAGDLAPFVDILSRPRGSAHLVADLLVTGPRMVLAAFSRLKELNQISRIEIDQCAAALALVYARTDAVPYEEFDKAGWQGQLMELKHIDGVYFLKAGLLLSDELRQEFNALN